MAENSGLLPDKSHYCNRCWAMTTTPDGLKALLSVEGYQLCSRQELVDGISGGCVFCKKIMTRGLCLLLIHFSRCRVEYEKVRLTLNLLRESGEPAQRMKAQTLEELVGIGKIKDLTIRFADFFFFFFF